MPIERGYEVRDGKRWGYYTWNGQTRYYYTPGNERSRKTARTKAEQQREAAYASGYEG